MSEQFIVRGMGQKKDVTALTGAQRDNQDGKYRFDLIGLHMLKRLSRLMEAGAKKYEPHNWAKGQETERTLASLWRHLIAYQEGDRVEDHLAAIVFNAMSIIHVEEEVKAGRLPVALLNVPFYKDTELYKEACEWVEFQERNNMNKTQTQKRGFSIVTVVKSISNTLNSRIKRVRDTE